MLEVDMSEEGFQKGLAFYKKLIEHGYYVMRWPKESGGQSRSVIDQAVFNESYTYYGKMNLGDTDVYLEAVAQALGF